MRNRGTTAEGSGKQTYAFSTLYEKTSPSKPSWGGWGVTGSSGTGGAQRRRCLPLCPLGGGGRGKGAASTGVLLPLPGGQECRLAAQRLAGAVQRRRRISRCTDRSAGGCADRPTATTERARAFGGLEAAEAPPRRRGPLGPLDRTTLPLSAVGAAARSRRRAGPGWQRRLHP